MAGFRKILASLASRLQDRRGVTAAEYAILAVGIVIVVGAAVMQYGLNDPLTYAGSVLTSGQSSLAAGAR